MTDTDIEGILYYAISRELESNVFYNLLSQYTDDPQLQAICSDLAGEELEHKARLELEIIKLGRVAGSFSLNRPNGKALSKPLDYMLEMAKVMRMSLSEVILLAIEKEKAAFRFYIESLSKVQDEQCRDVLMALAEEEARHKVRFELEYDRLKTARQKSSI